MSFPTSLNRSRNCEKERRRKFLIPRIVLPVIRNWYAKKMKRHGVAPILIAKPRLFNVLFFMFPKGPWILMAWVKNKSSVFMTWVGSKLSLISTGWIIIRLKNWKALEKNQHTN